MNAEMLRGTSIVNSFHLKFYVNWLILLKHWHGLLQPGTFWADGVAGVTQCPISPNRSFEYVFRANARAGTFWYHSHYCALRSFHLHLARLKSKVQQLNTATAYEVPLWCMTKTIHTRHCMTSTTVCLVSLNIEMSLLIWSQSRPLSLLRTGTTLFQLSSNSP